jgi:hypothetical protein
MTKFALMPTATSGMPFGATAVTATAAIDAFTGATSIRGRMVTSPVATGHASVAAVAVNAAAAGATDAYSWDNRQLKSAKWARPPRGETP